MPFATQIVPMPYWSTPIGCIKLALSVLVLGFVVACLAIWGNFAAFILSTSTATLSLFAFTYYLTALSFKSRLYNKWLVLGLEFLLMLLWLASFTLLAAWTAETLGNSTWSCVVPQRNVSKAIGGAVSLSQRASFPSMPCSISSPLYSMKRFKVDAQTTPARMHGYNAHVSGRPLASIATAFAGVNFTLYAVTLMLFCKNLFKLSEFSSPSRDHEAEPFPTRSATLETAVPVSHLSALPPAVTAPLRVDTLPKDFEPKPQTQEHYSTPEQAADAGIEPPTPVLKAQTAEKVARRADGMI